jgi:tetratricopeptide (TPR) repeat protein
MFLFFSGCATFEKKRPEVRPQEEVDQHLLRGRELLAEKDFEGALTQTQEILALATHRPPEDEALYTVGVIYAHPENPNRNPVKSLQFFARVAEDYPRSLWAEQARAWTGILQENGRLNQSIENLSRQVKQMHHDKTKLSEEREARRPLLNGRELLLLGKYEEASQETQRLLSASPRHHLEDEALFQMGLIFIHPGNPKKDYGKSMNYFKKLIKDFPQSSWSELAKIWTGMLQENERLSQTVDKLNQTIEKSKQVDIEIEEKKKEKGK